MAIGKPRGKNGARPVFVYNPTLGRKVYVGSRVKVRGPGGAEELQREKQREFAGAPVTEGPLIVREYAPLWLDTHHGDGTRRPSPTTRQVNEGNLTAFVEKFGDRPLDRGIKRREALDWAKQNPHRAKTVSAMFNDAIDDEETQANPFANRRAKQSDERKNIHPLTEQEVDRLAAIALDRWGKDGYGLVARAWVLFGAWVGSRPGETFTVTDADLNIEDGSVTVQRVKGRRKRHVVALPDAVIAALDAMPRIPNPRGLLFPTVSGKPIAKGALRYYWDPIRSAFRQTITETRWQELLDGQNNLDFYVLRHFCASIIVDRSGNEYDVSDQLGNTPQVARETYIHSYEERRRERLRGLLNRSNVVDLEARRGSNRG